GPQLQGDCRGARLPDRHGDVAARSRARSAAPRTERIRPGARIPEKDGMNCDEVAARLHPYVDGELPVEETAAADAHVAGCQQCAVLVHRQRAFRRLLRQQLRESAPPELRARIGGAVRRDARRAGRRVSWLATPALAAAAALV